jgi:hypothetical protein
MKRVAADGKHGQTATGVRPGGEIVPSEDDSLQGDPVALASGHFPSLLKICGP